MPRAHRYFLPNHVWHITHRCHQRDFLLKFARDGEEIGEEIGVGEQFLIGEPPEVLTKEHAQERQRACETEKGPGYFFGLPEAGGDTDGAAL
jgi:putative transposase